jgi:hypothetical protein
MRRDFHFHVVYVLALAAGMNQRLAHKVAYASEHVDNSKEKDVIIFANGGQTQTLRSAHKMLSLKMYTDQTGLGIYMPFHFFPSCTGDDFFQKVLCYPRSRGLAELKHSLLNNSNKPFGPHLVGIGLHVIADSYAHQGFNALNDPRNRASRLKIENDVFMNVLFKLKPFFLPPFCHLKVLTCPDEPACQWSYQNYEKKRVSRNNLPYYHEAVEEIYDLFKEELYKVVPHWYDFEHEMAYDEVMDLVGKMLNLNMPHHQRLQAWDRAWDLSFFDDMPKPIYDEKAWFNESIDIKKWGPFKSYYRKKDYASSDWKLFQDALRYHVFTCKNEIFPKFGIYI